MYLWQSRRLAACRPLKGAARKRDKFTLCRKLKPAFFLQLFYNAVIHQILGREAADFFVVSAQQADDVANAVDARKDFPLVNTDDALITFLGVFDTPKAKSSGQAFDDLGLIRRDSDESNAIEQSSEHVLYGRRGRGDE